MSQPISKQGKLFLIGAGPGDPELLTLKAARMLGECDVVLYDRLVAHSILRHARPEAQLIYVGKQEGEQESVQSRIFHLILEHAGAGKVVGRLKGGDPLVFGRGAEEWALALEHGIPVEFVPGVSSSIGLAGLAGIPLTYRKVSQNFAVVTGHCGDSDPSVWRNLAHVDTLVILMGVKNRSAIAAALIDRGRRPDEPVAFIQNGSLESEETVVTTLAEVARGEVHVQSPAIFLIGQVVRLRDQLKLSAPTPGAPGSAG